MPDEIKDRIAKVHELVNRGATEGERAAARRALDRLMAKYNLGDHDLSDINKKYYAFKYASNNEQALLCYIIHFFFPELDIQANAYRSGWDSKALVPCRNIMIKLKYIDYVTIDSAYEYFRAHMKIQWNKTCAPLVAKCRKATTRNKKRKELQVVFIDQYAIASGLIPVHNVRTVTPSELSQAERERLMAMRDIEGGQYNVQVQNGLMLGQ